MKSARKARRPDPGGRVFALDAARIQAALARRARYRYVQPSVLPEGAGWKIASPNCSRNIDPNGGEIDIAWFQPLADGRWLLHARDHAAGAWRASCCTPTLAAALELVCVDEDRVYWP